MGKIDNNGGSYKDVVRLDFGAIANLLSVGLSSVDGLTGNVDDWIYGSHAPFPALSTATLLASGNQSSPGGINPTVALSGSYQYLFVTTGAATDNDFHLRSVSATVVGDVVSFGSGLTILPLVVWAVGVRASVPGLSVALLFGNVSRAWFSRRELDWSVVGAYLTGALPLSVLGAVVYAGGAWSGSRASWAWSCLDRMSDRAFVVLVEVLITGLGILFLVLSPG